MNSMVNKIVIWYGRAPTSASSSNRPKSSLRAVTKSEGSRAVVNGVKLTMSANKMLQYIIKKK